MPNLFRKNSARGSRTLKPKSRASVSKVPGGFTRTQFRAQHELIRAHLKFSFKDKETTLQICIQRKLGGLGDVLMTTPTIRAIRQEYPNCIITYATDPTLFRVLENNPDIDKIVDFRTIDPGNYDYFADVTSVCPPYEKTANPPINRIDLFAKYVGIQLRQYIPVYKPKVDEVEWAQKWLEQKWGKRDSYKLIFLSVASVDHRRTWPVEKTTQLINQITAFRPDVRIIIDDFNGRGGEWGQLNTTAEKFGFRPAAALINESDLFVGPDSGMLHLAGALGLSIVSIFGPTDPAARINHYPGAIAVTAELGCQYCWYARCNYNHACMNDLPVAKVQEYVLKKLDYKLPEGAFAENKFILHSLGQDPRTEAVKRGLKRGLTEAGYTTLENAIAIDKKDIVIDVISTDSIGFKAKLPPKGIINCAFAIVPGPIDKIAALRLAKCYDIILCSTAREVEYIWDAGIRKPTQIVSLPMFRSGARLNRENVSNLSDWKNQNETTLDGLLAGCGIVVDLNPNTDGVLITYALVQGALCIVHDDAELLISDSFLTRIVADDLKETVEWLQGDELYSNELVGQATKWCSRNLGESSLSVVITSIYQRMSFNA